MPRRLRKHEAEAIRQVLRAEGYSLRTEVARASYTRTGFATLYILTASPTHPRYGELNGRHGAEFHSLREVGEFIGVL